MDINIIRSAVTLIGLILFIGLVLWVYSGKRRAAYEDAARQPFLDDESASDRSAS